MNGYAAVILAGGGARRLGGVAKPNLPVGGVAMLERVLTAVRDARVRVVVGPETLEVPAGVMRTVEVPAGGGPVAAAAAGLALLGDDPGTVALLAADLPFLTGEAVSLLRSRLAVSTVDGAVFVDDEDRPQILCGVWRVAALHRRAAEMSAEGSLAGRSLRDFLGGLSVAEVSVVPDGPPPWYDCDEPTDLARAEGWA